ncbi:peroxide stress protein YaaA [Saprospiraceae bacterium]|nr:peroxide stress protein YaaA [Saprospiraceae bacterium]
MIILLSPAKSLDFSKHDKDIVSTSTRFNEESQQLINKLKKTSIKGLRELMKISKDLAVLNKQRYIDYDTEAFEQRGKEAVLAFNGGVYQGLEAKTLNEAAFDYTQDHLRILSGLYGLVRPLDKIQEYRLEMGTQLPIRRKKNLYGFWGDKITDLLNEDLSAIESETVVNLASQEYFGAVNTKKVKGNIITANFKEMHNGTMKFISFNAKKARGLMTRYAIDHSILDPQQLKNFDTEDYSFNEEMSTETEWMFTR